MEHILLLRGAIRHYEWGSRVHLAALQGRPVPSARPEAELWLGAHPRGPAEVRIDERWERLDALIERAAEPLLGAESIAAHGRRLPFLLKVLAVARPLSLQVHPDAQQAQAGFACPRTGAAPPVFADAHPKPELVSALSPFTALCGFRPLTELRAAFRDFGVEALLPEGEDDEQVAAGFLSAWLRADADVRAGALARVVAAASARAGEDPAAACVSTLAAEHPGDPGILAPLFLHRVDLAPGEALFLPAGELHCYVSGLAVELMGSSDNVLRGGLTTKPVHVEELLRITRFTPRRPPVLRAAPRAPGESVWPTPAAEFELSQIVVRGDAVAIEARAGVEVLWCTDGPLRVQCAVGEAIELERGGACLVPAAAGPYRVAGAGRAFRAGLPPGAAGSAAPQGGGPERRRGVPCGS